MPVLFAATELESFTTTSPNVTWQTLAGTFDSDYSRGACRSAPNSPHARLEAAFASASEGWAHFTMYHTNMNGSAFDGNIIQLKSGATVVMDIDGDNGFDLGDVSLEVLGVEVDTFSSPPLNTNELLTFDIHWVIDGVSGIFDVYIGGVLAASFSGDNTSAGSITGIDFLTLSNGTFSGDAYFSEVIIADEDTRGFRLATLEPTGDGANTAWTGTFADVDEADPNDADFIVSSTIDQVETYSLADLPAGSFTVKAVTVGMRAKNAAGAPENVQAAVRVGTTNYFSANLTGVTTSFGTLGQAIFDTSPDTSTGWTEAEINALEAGARSRT